MKKTMEGCHINVYFTTTAKIKNKYETSLLQRKKYI